MWKNHSLFHIQIRMLLLLSQSLFSMRPSASSTSVPSLLIILKSETKQRDMKNCLCLCKIMLLVIFPHHVRFQKLWNGHIKKIMFLSQWSGRHWLWKTQMWLFIQYWSREWICTLFNYSAFIQQHRETSKYFNYSCSICACVHARVHVHVTIHKVTGTKCVEMFSTETWAVHTFL